MKMLHKVWKKLIWVWNKCQGYEKSAWWYETNDKCSETNTHLKDAHIVLLTDFFRTVFVWCHWCGFVSYHCQWQYTLCTVFLYQAGFVSYHWNYFCTKQIHSCVSLFSWCTTWSTVHFSQPKMSQNLYCVPLVAHHEWICFVLLKLFLYFFIRILRILWKIGRVDSKTIDMQAGPEALTPEA